MSEWQLFPAGTVPEFSTPAFFAAHDWVPGEAQIGHPERLAMVVELIVDLGIDGYDDVVDLGAGDGSLLRLIDARLPGIDCWGYDLGIANQRHAEANGVDVSLVDIVENLAVLDLAGLIVCTEVLEHLVDPHRFLDDLAGVAAPDTVLIASSPHLETPDWHYEHHCWAWDQAGYAELLAAHRWAPFAHRTVTVGRYGFQAVAARLTP